MSFTGRCGEVKGDLGFPAPFSPEDWEGYRKAPRALGLLLPPGGLGGMGRGNGRADQSPETVSAERSSSLAFTPRPSASFQMASRVGFRTPRSIPLT